MDEIEIVKGINLQLQTEFSIVFSQENLFVQLAKYINHLIVTDFQKLVLILYRIDINEQKLKNLLQENAGEEAGNIIARLIIEREKQKIESRKKFKKPGFDDGEKW